MVAASVDYDPARALAVTANNLNMMAMLQYRCRLYLAAPILLIGLSIRANSSIDFLSIPMIPTVSSCFCREPEIAIKKEKKEKRKIGKRDNVNKMGIKRHFYVQWCDIGMDHITYSSYIIEYAELMGSTKNKSPIPACAVDIVARAEYRIHICLHHVDRKIRLLFFVPQLFATLCRYCLGLCLDEANKNVAYIRNRWKLKNTERTTDVMCVMDRIDNNKH